MISWEATSSSLELYGLGVACEVPVSALQLAEALRWVPVSAPQLAEAPRWVPASAPRWAEALHWVPASVPRLAPASHWVPVSVPRWAEAPRWVPVSAPRWAEAPRWVPAARRDLFPRRSCPSHLIPLLFPGTCRAVSPHLSDAILLLSAAVAPTADEKGSSMDTEITMASARNILFLCMLLPLILSSYTSISQNNSYMPNNTQSDTLTVFILSHMNLYFKFLFTSPQDLPDPVRKSHFPLHLAQRFHSVIIGLLCVFLNHAVQIGLVLLQPGDLVLQRF